MISNMSEDISTINKDMSFVRGRLDELRNNLENNRASNAKQERLNVGLPRCIVVFSALTICFRPFTFVMT